MNANDLVNLAPPVALMLMLNVLGFILKAMPKCPNWAIPLALPVAGAFLYPFIGEYSPVVVRAKCPWILMACYGAGIGWAATGAFEAVRNILANFSGPAKPPL